LSFSQISLVDLLFSVFIITEKLPKSAVNFNENFS